MERGTAGRASAPDTAAVEVVETVHCRSCWASFDAGSRDACPTCGQPLVAPNGLTMAELIGRAQNRADGDTPITRIARPEPPQVQWSTMYRWGLAINAAAAIAWLLVLARGAQTVPIVLDTPLGTYTQTLGGGPYLALGMVLTCVVTAVLIWVADSPVMQWAGLIAGTMLTIFALTHRDITGIAFIFVGAGIATVTALFAVLFPDRVAPRPA